MFSLACAQGQVSRHALRSLGFDACCGQRNGEMAEWWERLKPGITKVWVPLFTRRLANYTLRFGKGVHCLYWAKRIYFAWGKKSNISNVLQPSLIQFVLKQTLGSQSVKMLYKGAAVFEMLCLIQTWKMQPNSRNRFLWTLFIGEFQGLLGVKNMRK